MEATSISQLGTNQRFGRVDVLGPDQIEAAVNEVLGATQFIDIHTHLYPPAFGSLGLWGVDE